MLLTNFSIGGDGMALVEYLYVDEERLDTYFEQISSPVTYDKVPMWNAEIGMLGPKAGGAQQRFARPYTTHEKISTLTEHLENAGLVGYGRAGGDDVASEPRVFFRMETCRAKRVFIPPNHGQPLEIGALTLWISSVSRTREEIEAIREDFTAILKNPRQWEGMRSLSSRRPGNLYLLEDYRYADGERITFGASPYSALSLLIGLDQQGPLTPSYQGPRYFKNLTRPDYNKRLDPAWVEPDTAEMEPDAKRILEESNLPDTDKEHIERHITFMGHFLIDPASALAQIGAQIAPERRIRTLYRVRAFFAEAELAWNYDWWEQATFGYPIFIAEDTDPV
jgi:hypothetical protein